MRDECLRTVLAVISCTTGETVYKGYRMCILIRWRQGYDDVQMDMLKSLRSERKLFYRAMRCCWIFDFLQFMRNRAQLEKSLDIPVHRKFWWMSLREDLTHKCDKPCRFLNNVWWNVSGTWPYSACTLIIIKCCFKLICSCWNWNDVSGFASSSSNSLSIACSSVIAKNSVEDNWMLFIRDYVSATIFSDPAICLIFLLN